MLTVFRPAAAFLTAAVLLAGCGGGGGSSHQALPAALVPGQTAPPGTAPVTLTFYVPKAPSGKRRAPQSTGRQPAYITSATAAIKVTLTAVANPTTHAAVTPPGGLPQITTIQVTSTAQNPNTPGQCGPDPANAGNIKCTETINLPLGDDSLTIATYDGFSGGNATGNIISQQRAVASVVQGALNTFTFTLDANSSAFTVFPPASVTAASGSNCTSSAITGASDISATCTATITGSSATNFGIVVPDSHGSTIPVTAPGAPVLSVTSSNNANFTASISGSTLTITPHSVNVSAKITLTATPANTSGASPGDGLSTVVLAFTVANVPGTTWKTRTPTGLARKNGAAGVINSILYVAGGTTGATFTNTGSAQSYDPSTTTWTTLANMNVPRTLVSGDQLLGKFFVVGGSDAGGNVVNTNEAYDPSLTDPTMPPGGGNPPIGWTSFTGMNHARIRHRAVTVGAQLFVFGGLDSGGTRVAIPESYNADTDSWTDLAPMPTSRDDVAVATLGGFIYVIGGRTQTSDAVNTVERYDPANDVWTTVAPLPQPLRYQHAAAINGKIYVASGFTPSGVPSAASAVFFYDPSSNTWVTGGPPLPFQANLSSTSAQGNNLMYIVNLGPSFDQLIELSSP